MDRSVLSRLQHAEVDLLDALVGGECAMGHFANDWATLSTDIQNALQSGSLNESTISTVHLTASRISIISQNFLDFRIQADALTSDLMSEVEQLLSNVSLEVPPKVPHPPITTAAHDSHARSSSTLYVEPSCRWLLQNLHNPYPPKKVKESIARQADCPIKDIDNWFVETRRRIGWSALRRSHFSNKRQSIVEAASRFFGKAVAVPQSSPDLELEFANIQKQAENLYLNRFSERPLESDSSSREACGLKRRKRRSTSLQTGSDATRPSNIRRISNGDFTGCPSGNDNRRNDTCSTKIDNGASSVAPLQRACSSPATYADCSKNRLPASMPLSQLLPSESSDSTPTTSSLKRKRRGSFTDTVEKSKRPRQDHLEISLQAPFTLPTWSSSIPTAEDAFQGTDLSGPLEIEPFDFSELLGLSNNSCHIESYIPGNTGAFSSNNSRVESGRENVIRTDQPSVASVTDHSDFTNQQPPPLNNPPHLDITLDGLADQIFGSGALFDWLTPLFDDTNVNGWMQPDSVFQLDLPPVGDLFPLTLPLSSTVY